MKKSLVLLLLLLLSVPFFACCASGIIRNVSVSGNKNVSEQRILLLIKSRPGTEFSEETVREDVRRLGETGYFSNISYRTEEKPDGVALIFSVTERPVIASISFSGNKIYDAKKLKEFLGIKEGDFYDETKVRTGLDVIGKKYQEKSVFFTVTDFSVKEENGKADLTVTIKEGTPSVIRTISFTGLKFATPKTLKKMMRIKERRMPFIRGTFKEDAFEEDQSTILNYYRRNGFLDAAIIRHDVEPKGKLLFITIGINEGTRYRVGKISFSGNLLVPETTLRGLLTLKREDDIFNAESSQTDLAAIKGFYMDRGHVNITVDAVPKTADSSPERIDIVYAIEPGSVYTVEEVRIEGNSKTRDKVIRREIMLSPGDVFSGEKIRRSFNKLHDLNYFEGIALAPAPLPDSTRADLTVNVKEREKTGTFMVGGGYSSSDGVVGFVSIEQNNFDITNWPGLTGGGQDAKLWVQIGSESRGFNISFTEPWLWDKPIWIGPDIYNFQREWSDYTEKRWGGDLRVGRRWDRASLGFTFKMEDIKLSDMQIPSLVVEEKTYAKHSLATHYEFSTLDSKLTPATGNRVNATVEYAGGILAGNLEFIKTTAENNYYHPFIKKTVFHSKTMAGVINGFGDTPTVPIFERFFGGGIGTVRGYEERTLGPHDSSTDDPLGGEVIFAQNFELLYPIYQDILKGVVFYDIGNIWEKWGSFDDMKQGAGIGVRIFVPLLNAPISLDYGFALNPDQGESGGRLHVGMNFWF